MPKTTHPSTHPPLPPTTEDDRVSWLRLLRSRRVGPATFHRLLSEHGSAEAALAALPEVARAAGVPDYTPCPLGVVEAELRAGQAIGARLLTSADPAFPQALRDIPDCPPLLWIMGDPALLARPMIALVGARNASSLGTRMARSLAADLSARGYLIVSGLARGIDTAAHLGSVERGTVAVMAGGVDVIYPAENTKLAGDILATGLRLSEQPMGLIPQARHFPNRNRLVSGLAQAVVVVEAAAKSGSLLTARNALDQGREVMAVPGHPIDARASGCNMLIRDGATLIRNAEDVIDALPQVQSIQIPPQPDLPLAPAAPPSLRDIAGLHAQILNRLGPSPLAEDQLIRDLATPAHRVAPALLDLELDGRITRHPGGLLALAR
ncbi:MAG: DNA-processing protein DprA [Roseovarius sp.]|uniref:DNA-processing protein DprA n=1 Tax=Roseovarius sp. TaxID=1486281 RepID=UPI001B702C77|nr:DNA-processing protein DprA [Roseovarius sp.]MBQ0749837.1 DNA-processing protein DprA [Roseovarius sp.]MBQ0809358.1 DNA-processing protein DprA [Roseovarius sp.]